MIPYVSTENLKNHTLSGGAYLYIGHIWEYPPPPGAVSRGNPTPLRAPG